MKTRITDDQNTEFIANFALQQTTNDEKPVGSNSQADGDQVFKGGGRAGPIARKTSPQTCVGGDASADRIGALIMSGKPFRASGTLDQHAFSGGSGHSSANVEFLPLPDGRLALADLRSKYISSDGEDVILEPDGLGGYYGMTSRGDEWTLTPADAQGERSLVLAPTNQGGVISQYQLRVQDPTADLALFNGTKVRFEEELSQDTPATPIDVRIDTAGDHLRLRVDKGDVRELEFRAEDGSFADHEDPICATATAKYDPASNSYRLTLEANQTSYDAKVGPVTGPTKSEPSAQSMLAFVTRGDEVMTIRAQLSEQPDGGSILRLSQTDYYLPPVMYFGKARRSRASVTGVSRDNGTARLYKPDADGNRKVSFETEHGVCSTIKLVPFDGAAAVADFAGKTGQLKILAPDGTDANGHPSRDLAPQTFTLRFGEARPGSDRLPLEIDVDGQTNDDLVFMPTEWGAFTISNRGQRLWITPNEDGTFTAEAEWFHGTRQGGGTFELTA